MFRAVVLAEGDEIGPQEFPQLAAREATAEAISTASLVPDHGAMRLGGETSLVVETAPSFAPDRLALARPAACSHLRPLDELEAEIIRFAIAHYRGQMSEVARRLRIGRSTLYRKLEGLRCFRLGPARTGHRPVAAE